MMGAVEHTSKTHPYLFIHNANPGGCSKPAFRLSEGLLPGSCVYVEMLQHLDLSPFYEGSLICCDSCGGSLDLQSSSIVHESEWTWA